MNNLRRFVVIVATIGLMPSFAIAQHAQFTAPAAIERAVERFTGRETGTVGGARRATDSRLKLAVCPETLAVEWYGRPGTTVSVSCPVASGWRIYVSLLAVPATEPAGDAVKRGEIITVIVEGRGFAIQRQGKAMESGPIGSWIAVQTSQKAAPIHAKIKRPGLAIIPFE